MKIALIGPGLIEIPPKGWGAVEILIWKYNLDLMAAGHEVVIFNTPNLPAVAKAVNEGNFDFVHLHYDEYVRFFAEHLRRPFCSTSHYGYITKLSRWSRGYYSIFVDFFRAPGIVALSPAIAALYKDNGYQGKTYVLPNGVDVSAFAFSSEGNGRAIYLGKIEVRKRQAFLSRALDGKATVDFIGPMADREFKEGETTRYCGAWTKEQVYQHLTDYSCLVLLSDCEAAPLVVPEALAAGLSVVVSKSAAANLDRQEFISVVSDDEADGASLAAIINKQIAGNGACRVRIREYAVFRFGRAAIMEQYLSIIDDFRKTGTAPSLLRFARPNHYQSLRYWYSRMVIFLRTNVITRPLVDMLRRAKTSPKK